MSSLNRSTSFESIASSRSLLEVDKAELDPTPIDPAYTIASLVQSPTASERCLGEGAAVEVKRPAYAEHACFFLPAENIFFVVANILYSVPRSPFEKHSSAFTGKGLTRDNPMVLEDVAAAHLDNLLSLLYPSEYGVYTATSVEEWTSILHLAVRWGFESIKNLSIERLAPIASDIDKIVLGRQYAIDEWLGDAYLAICSREECLSKKEGRRMQVDDIIEISAIRHQFGLGALSKVALPLSIGQVCVRFGLAASGSAVSDAGFHCGAQGDLAVTPMSSLTQRSPAGIDTGIPPEPKKPSEKVDLLKEAREAAARALAEWVMNKEMTERALHAFADSSQNPLYAEAGENEQNKFYWTAIILKNEWESTKRTLEARACE